LREPNARFRLPKKLRKRKWKITAIKHFIGKHVFGHQDITSDEVTSSRAAENQRKPPFTKDQLLHTSYYADDEVDDDDDDEKDGTRKSEKYKSSEENKKKKANERARDGIGKNGGANERANERSTEPTNERTPERARERVKEVAKNQMRKELFESAPEPGMVLKLIWGLEHFSLCASDLNVVIFFFLLPWIRQLWR